jgi:hypothetical protein
LNTKLETAVIAMPLTETHDVSDQNLPLRLLFVPLISSIQIIQNGSMLTNFTKNANELIVSNLQIGTVRVNYKPEKAIEWETFKEDYLLIYQTAKL